MSDNQPPNPAAVALRALGNIGQGLLTIASTGKPRRGAKNAAPKAKKENGCTPCAAHARVQAAKDAVAKLRGTAG